MSHFKSLVLSIKLESMFNFQKEPEVSNFWIKRTVKSIRDILTSKIGKKYTPWWSRVELWQTELYSCSGSSVSWVSCWYWGMSRFQILIVLLHFFPFPLIQRNRIHALAKVITLVSRWSRTVLGDDKGKKLEYSHLEKSTSFESELANFFTLESAPVGFNPIQWKTPWWSRRSLVCKCRIKSWYNKIMIINLFFLFCLNFGLKRVNLKSKRNLV